MREPHQVSPVSARLAARLCTAVIGLLLAVNAAAQTRDVPTVAPFTGTLRRSTRAVSSGRTPGELPALCLP